MLPSIAFLSVAICGIFESMPISATKIMIIFGPPNCNDQKTIKDKQDNGYGERFSFICDIRMCSR